MRQQQRHHETHQRFQIRRIEAGAVGTTLSRVAQDILLRHAAGASPSGNDEYSPFPHEQYPYGSNRKPEFGGLVPFLIRVLRCFLTATIWLVVSGGSYMLFYRWMMPDIVVFRSFSFHYHWDSERRQGHNENAWSQSHQAKNLIPQHWHLRAETCDTDDAIHSTMDDSALPFSQPKEPPYAEIDLWEAHNTWEAVVPDVKPTPASLTQLLKPRQHYYVDLALELPESAANSDAGMFVVKVVLFSSNNHTLLARSQRSTRLPHESAWIGVARKLVLILAFVVGALEESRTVFVTPFRQYTESVDHPARYVHASLHGQSIDTVIEVNQASLRIGEEMNTMQELLKEYYYTCFLLGTFTFVCFYMMLCGICRMVDERMKQRHFDSEEPPCDLNLDDDEIDNVLDDDSDDGVQFEDATGTIPQQNHTTDLNDHSSPRRSRESDGGGAEAFNHSRIRGAPGAFTVVNSGASGYTAPQNFRWDSDSVSGNDWEDLTTE